jgi:Gluconate 2-dehydrogenase subunit 3
MVTDFALDRRAMMQQVALLLGVAALPAEAFAAKMGKTQGFLPAKSMKLLSAVSDTIVPATDTPGAVAAGVPAKLDGMLANWASPDTRKLVVEALGRIDAAAKSSRKKGFAALDAAGRAAVLKPHDAAALKPVAPPPGAPKISFFTPTPYVADNGYLKLKGLIITLYYNSEIAMTKELVYEHVPGTWQPSIKADDKTRPWASVGPF